VGNIFTTLDTGWLRLETWLRRHPLWLWVGCALLLAGFIVGGGIASRTVNARSNQGDQNAYLQYTEKLRETGYQYLGDRNRMPLYPGLQAVLVMREGMERPQLFRRGKRLNQGLAVLGLGLLGLAMARFVKPWPVFLFTGGMAMGLYLPKSAYFQAEILYYTLFTLFFIGGAWILHRPRWWGALALGGIAALAHWTKASILPGVTLLTAVLALRGLYAAWRFFRKRPEALWTSLHCLGAAALLPAVYLGGIAPYLLKSAEKFNGHYFYNVNSTFYIWCDNFEQTKRLRDAGDRKGWPRLPEDELPSLRKYLSEKSPAEIAGRFFGGVYHQYKIAKGSYGAWKFVLPLAVLFILLARRGDFLAWARKYRWSLFFGAGFLGGYFALISFYSPIADGARFLFALYGPVLTALVWAVEKFPGKREKMWVNRLLTVLILTDLPLKLLFFMGKTYCGS
jgi:hypothetical protein